MHSATEPAALRAPSISHADCGSTREYLQYLPESVTGDRSQETVTRHGAEGEEGDVAHAAAMKQFSISEFGSSHVQDRTIDDRMCEVGLFGYWLELNHYGKYVEWRVADGASTGIEPRPLMRGENHQSNPNCAGGKWAISSST